MSEIALQGLLDRTKADEQDEEAMDMTVINGVRMSKYDILGNGISFSSACLNMEDRFSLCTCDLLHTPQAVQSCLISSAMWGQKYDRDSS
jgi:hypothetical protein